MIPGHFMNKRLSVIMHHCQACGGDTPCGTVSVGATPRTQADLQAANRAMAQQDELANLFASSMNFSNPTPPPDEAATKPEHFRAPQQEEPQRVYASTHYIPPTSFHTNSTPQASPEPEPRPLGDNEIAQMLVQNQIDPHSLFPSQVALFRHAGDEQRQRLLELWRISPPNLGAYDLQKQQSSWLETTLAREEEVARLRYERAVIESQGIGSPYQAMSRPSSAPATTQVEPYMMSGYELLAQKEYEKGAVEEPKRYTQATDPVYAYHGGWKQNVEEMENRYGAFEAQRGGMGAMNGLDEEMVM